MLGKLTFVAVVSAFGAFGCGVGGGDGGGGSGSQMQGSDTPLPTCAAQLALSGTFTAEATLDPAGGCQPTGTWVVNVALADKGNCANVPFKSSYTYTMTGSGHDSVLHYTASSGEEFSGAVNATGSGGCEGSFEHIVVDGQNFDQLNLHPLLPTPTAGGTTLTIGGVGEYDLWDKHP